nr:MAG TPA: hypothetical protein [Caudoviricetes sp.]
MGKRKLPLFFVIWKRSIFNSSLLFLSFVIINIWKNFLLYLLTFHASYAIINHKELGGKPI